MQGIFKRIISLNLEYTTKNETDVSYIFYKSNPNLYLLKCTSGLIFELHTHTIIEIENGPK